MCGITGLINWGNREVLARMTDLQAHRGPDDHGLWEHCFSDGSYIGLGNRRLAILDLSSAGHMPMSSEDGKIWITYNGEVYNFPELRQELITKGHQLRSNTDTEVLLYLYERDGPDFVRRLNGMFAFGICDMRGSSPLIMIARDHFGIKPLYYTQQGNRIAFASEIKSLLQVPDVYAEIDQESLHQYLTFLWVPEPRTMFCGISKLPAGHYAIYKNGQFGIVCYWDLTFPPINTVFPFSEGELVEELRHLFLDAVKSQMISDVPIGAFLSAGLDSSSIVAMMAKITNSRVRTYTITFPRKHRIGEGMDDPAVAARVAQHFGCDHNEIVVEPQVTRLIPDLIWHMDEPVADPAIIMNYLVCRAARQHATVMISGVGGDEIFAGYRKYSAQRWAHLYRHLPTFLRREIIEPFLLNIPILQGTPLKGLVRLLKKMALSGSLPFQDAFLMNSTYLSEKHKDQIYSPDMYVQTRGIDPWQQHRAYFARVAHADSLNQMLYVDTKSFMVSLNLMYNDKMSMASSVEVRVPFLDRNLVEFAARHIPPKMKLSGFFQTKTKYLLRQAMNGMLPDEVLHQAKASFGAPVDYWLRHDLCEMVDDLLSEKQVRQRGIFAPQEIRRLITEHRNGLQDWSMQIWQFLTLELWMQTFIDNSTGAKGAVK